MRRIISNIWAKFFGRKSDLSRVRVKFQLSNLAAFVLALILPIFAVAPLFYPGYIQTHSGFVPLWNVADWSANLGWVPHLVTHFDPLRSDGLLPYYLAGALPFSPVVGVKVVTGIGWLLGSVGMFLWLKSWLGNPGALVAALVHTYLPYQIATVYVRGAWGEALFWGLLPWALLTVTYLVTSPKSPVFIIAIVFWLLSGLSQLGLTIWAFIFIVLLLLIIHLRQSLWPILAAFLGTATALSLTMSLVAPITSPISFADHFLYPFQLFSARWGFGVSQPGWDDGLSLQLGLAAVGLTIVTVVLWQRSDSLAQHVSRTDRRLIFFLAAAIILTVLTLGVAAFWWRLPIWPGLTLAHTLTYPWQLLGLAGLCLAILAGAALWLDEQLTRLPLFAAIIIFIVLSSYTYLSPQFIQPARYVDSPPQAELGNAQVTLVDHSFSVLTGGHTAGFNRGQIAIPLAIHGPLQANDVLRVNVIWHPLQTLIQNFKVFVHLVDPAGNVIAQYDGHPQSGQYPTAHWIPGELIEDAYPILFPADAPPGPYRVFLGLYDEATLTRLSVFTDSEGRVILNVE
jgi:hypothetical protein